MENKLNTKLLESLFPFLDQEALTQISQNGKLVSISNGATVIRKGKDFQSIILVLEGTIKVYRIGDMDDIFLYYLEPGCACAVSLMCNLTHKTSELSIKALENSQVILLPSDTMRNLMEHNKSWYTFVLETYHSRFNDLFNAIDNFIFKKLDERLLDYLKLQSEKIGSRTLSITHQQIAEDLHSSREAISRLLKSMEQKGLLAINRNSILLKVNMIKTLP